MSMSSITCKSLDFDVIKDLTRGGGDDSPYLESLNIFKHGWKYRGEGNANVVLALQDDQRVIRLSKVNVGEPVGDLAKHRRKVEREVIFANRVFGPMIGPEFVGSVKAIQLSADQISRLNEMLLDVRPAHRLHKEIRVPYATSHSDFARINRSPSEGADFCVEIKPKQGWWPNSLRNCDGDLPNLCTYCLNQFLKLKRSKISSRTSYCPLDLFSGNPQRMIEAVTALIANPQNNFRIFYDGKLVFGEYNDESLNDILNKWMTCSESSSPSFTQTEMPSALNSFIYLLCVSLLKPKYIPENSSYPQSIDTFTKITQELRKSLSNVSPSQLYAKILSKNTKKLKVNEDKGDVGKENLGGSCNAEAAPLPEGCILHRILEIQKLADRQKTVFAGGDSTIYKIYQKICPVHSSKFVKKSPRLRSPSDSSSENLFGNEEVSDERSPKLNVVLAGDSYDNFADSGTETERLSDSESFEECFDVSSTEDDEDETITGAIDYKENFPISKRNDEDYLFTPSSLPVPPCPSVECLEKEKWLDEIEDLHLTEAETMTAEMYLLAATAKDCSIMVTFAPVNNNNSPGSMEEPSSGTHESETPFTKDTDVLIEDLGNRTHRVRIGVADLDPKPVTTIVRHYLRDNEMLQAYATYCKH